jgi:hypothetical protein
MRQVGLALWGVVLLTAGAWLLVMFHAGSLALGR